MRNRYVIAGFAMLVAAPGMAQEKSQHNYKPAAGYVSESTVAIKIAIAVWEPIYGKEAIAEQVPYRAKLVDDVWIIQGSLPQGVPGGVALAEISKDDGRILRVSHGK